MGRKTSSYYYSDSSSVDKGWAWMVLLGANLWNVTVSGTLKSFGVLFVELMVIFDSSPSETGWLGFTFCVMMIVFSPFAGYLGDIVSPRWIMMTGGLVAASGVFLTGFVPSLPWAIVSYGVIAGGAVGIMDSPVFGVLNKYFKKRRALANSLAFTGSGIGCLVLPLLIRVCVHYYTIRGAMLILGGLWLHSLVIGALFRPIRLEDTDLQVKVGMEEQKSEEQKRDNCLPQEVVSAKSELTDEKKVLACIKQVENQPEQKHEKSYSTPRLVLDFQETKLENGTKFQEITNDQLQEVEFSQLPTTRRKSKCSVVRETICDYWSFLCNPAMLRVVLAIMFGGFAYFNQIFLFPPLAEELGISRIKGALLVSLIGIMETVSRIPLGIICDKPFINKPLLVSVLGLLCCALALVVSFFPLWEVLLAYVCICGCLGGTIIPLGMPLLADVVTTARIGPAAGLFLWAMGMSLAIGPPVLGAMKETTGTYIYSFQFTTLMYIPAACLLLWDVIIPKCQQRTHIVKSKKTTDTKC